GIRLAPRLQQVGRLREPEPLAVVTLEPRELLEPLDHVVRVAEAHLGRTPDLLEPPCATRLDEQDADHARSPRSKERAERPRRGPNVAFALFLDQRVLQREVAVAREIHEAEVVALQDSCALGPDVNGPGHRIGAGKLSANVVQPRNGSTNMTRLAER